MPSFINGIPSVSSPRLLGFDYARMLAPQTVAYIAAMTVPPSKLVIKAIDRAIRGLIQIGCWDQLTFFGIHCLNTWQASLVNARNPSRSLTSSTSPDLGWIANRGIQASLGGGTKYTYANANEGSRFSATSVMLGGYNLTRTARAQYEHLIAILDSNASSYFFLSKSGSLSNQYYSGIAWGGFTAAQSTTEQLTTGLMVAMKGATATNSLGVYFNGVQDTSFPGGVGTDTVAANYLTATSTLVLGFNPNNSVYSIDILPITLWGGTLPVGRMADFSQIINNLVIELGVR